LITSEELIDAINYGGDVYTICQALRRPTCPRKALEFASKAHKWEYRCAVAEGNPTKKILGQLARDRSMAVKSAVASHKNTPSYAIDKILEKNELCLDILLCEREDLSEKQFKILFQRGASRQMALATTKTRSQEEYLKLAKTTLNVRIVLARNASIGPQVQEELAKDPGVIPHLLLNKSLDEKVWGSLPSKYKVGGKLLRASEYERVKWEL
jgi:hypothetical protein